MTAAHGGADYLVLAVEQDPDQQVEGLSARSPLAPQVGCMYGRVTWRAFTLYVSPVSGSTASYPSWRALDKGQA